MKATEELHELGQSIWLDNITRQLLDSGQLRRYIDDYAVTGLTSNPVDLRQGDRLRRLRRRDPRQGPPRS